MLILTRRPGDSMTFYEANLLQQAQHRALEIEMEKDTIQVFVLGLVAGKVRIGIQAPRHLKVASKKANLTSYGRRPSRY